MNTPSRMSNLSMHSAVNTSASHNLERITTLAEKLNNIQYNLKSEKVQKFTKLDENLRNNGEKLIEFCEENQQKFQGLKEEITKIYQRIDTENTRIDNIYEEKMQYLNTLEEKIVEKFEEESRVFI
jgi:uncharacterized coiled-coil DUF342 family protein